jgi:hypothetical protein
LLRYYSIHEMEEKRVPLVLWLIDHHPESSLHGDLTYIFPFPFGDRPGDPEGFADASQRWWTQVSQHPQDAQVLGNAAYTLGAGSIRDEIYLLKRAQALDGKSWTKPLAHLYSYVLVFSTEVGPERNVFGNPLRSSELAAQIRSDLQESDDIELIGAVAFEVVEQSVRRASGHDGRSWDFAALRASATDLITRAEMLDPQNQYVLDAMGGSNGRWSDLMEDVSGLGKAPVREPASPAKPSALPQ